MAKHIHVINGIALTLLCIISTGCQVAMNKSGILSASVDSLPKSQLRDIHTLMLTNGYQMIRSSQSTSATEDYTTAQEDWRESAWGESSRFVDPSYPSLVINFIYTDKEKRLLVICNENYMNKYKFVQTGFSMEGQTRADQVIQLIKQRFEGSVKIVERTNYTGSH